MRPVCLLDRTKNLHQFDGLHFISDSLELQKKLLQKLHIKHHEKQICVSDKTVIQNTQLYYDEEEEIL